MQPGYLPWPGYFDLVASADIFVLYDDVQFDSGSWRNRNRILNRGKAQWLTAPVRRRFPQLIRDTEITDTAWQQKHLKTLSQIYARAPGFEYCYPEIENYLSARKYRWLLDLCVEGHKILTGLLGISTPVRLSSEIGASATGKTARLVDICQRLNATAYLSANASKSYMEPGLWEDVGISLAYQDYPVPVYPQFGDDFIERLSVVDLLMFAGADARASIGPQCRQQGSERT